MKFFKTLSDNNILFYIFFSYLLSRLLIQITYNISIDEKWIFGLWQHISKIYLNDNLFKSILYFHAQPPLWNFIIGIGVKIEEILSLVFFVKIFNIICSLIIIYCYFNILKLLKFNNLTIYFFCFILIILSPSILFYENLPTYSHFTCTLIFLIKLFFIKIYENYKNKYEIFIYIFSTLLIFTWSGYVLYFNVLIFFLLIPLVIKKKRLFKSLLIFIFFFVIGSLPSIKNKILFDIFANSSWTGLNAAQSTGYDRVEWELCSFQKENLGEYNLLFKTNTKKKNFYNEDILNDYSFNDLGYIFKSKSCSFNAKKYLINNFFEISKQKAKRFLSVHAHLSIDFAFKPKNWKSSFGKLEKINLNEYFKYLVFIFFISIYFFYIYLSIIKLRKNNKDYIDYFILINLFLYSYLIFISFYGSTWEQERMRYTGYSFLIIAIALFFKSVSERIKNSKHLKNEYR